MTAGSNRLTVLAGEITEAHQRIRASAERMAEQALDLGRKLIAAKAEVQHGSWAGWLEANTSISSRSAQRYMRLTASGIKCATVADIGLRAAEKSLAREKKGQTDLDDGEGWRMPLPGEEVFISGPCGAFAVISVTEDLPAGSPRFYNFIMSRDGCRTPPLYNKRGSRAWGVARALEFEEFSLNDCEINVFEADAPNAINKLLLEWRADDRALENAMAAERAL